MYGDQFTNSPCPFFFFFWSQVFHLELGMTQWAHPFVWLWCMQRVFSSHSVTLCRYVGIKPPFARRSLQPTISWYGPTSTLHNFRTSWKIVVDKLFTTSPAPLNPKRLKPERTRQWVSDFWSHSRPINHKETKGKHLVCPRCSRVTPFGLPSVHAHGGISAVVGPVAVRARVCSRFWGLIHIPLFEAFSLSLPLCCFWLCRNTN